MLKRSSAVATAEGSYAQKIPSDKPGELWLRHFLIDHSTNKRGWSISKQTSWQNVLSAIGAPIVLKMDESSHADHPEYNIHADASWNTKEQNKYKIGTIER